LSCLRWHRKTLTHSIRRLPGVGDYRIISSIEDGAARILVVTIGNRREVYQ
jgi:mRNA-degrading endonuclease RelE of RelBE toxin-antitoxin system